jgi:hypothetical protein
MTVIAIDLANASETLSTPNICVSAIWKIESWVYVGCILAMGNASQDIELHLCA